MKKQEEELVQTTAQKFVEQTQFTLDELQTLILKGILGGEITEVSRDCIESWAKTRLMPSVVSIDADGYGEMCVDALKVATKTTATDFGGSRQRDLGQLWADLTRGYLGELAFKKYLERRHGLIVELGHETGRLEDYLPSDISAVIEAGQSRTPNLNVGIKSTKINGIWFDIPGDQFEHSDAHVLVKVATGRDHLFGFLKSLSVFKDKVLAQGVGQGTLTEKEADALFSELPDFSPIQAYVCGFVWKAGDYTEMNYGGHMGKKHFTINSWRGPIRKDDLGTIRRRENIQEGGRVTFESIGKFAHNSGYLFNTGNLCWRKEDWAGLASRL